MAGDAKTGAVEAIEAKVMKFVCAEFGQQDLDVCQPLFSSGLLDSLDSLEVILFVESEFSISIDPFALGIDDLDSVAQIAGLVIDRLNQ